MLKPTDLDDADFVFRLLNSPTWLKYIGDRDVKNLSDARSYITNKISTQFARLGYANYTMIIKDTGEKIGSCGLYDREGLVGVDLGFALLPEFEGNGYAFEASAMIRDLAFNRFHLPELSAITTEDNISSQRLLDKLGFDFSQHIRIKGDPARLRLYELKAPPANGQ